ncbi:MAG: peptidoglycan-binding domain-containing protein, partial [Patescibacteria group bacterium]
MNSKNKVFKKGVSVALAIATSLSLSAGALVMPLAASADATSDLIASLQAQISALSAQLTALSGGSMSSGSSAKCVFTKSLTMGMKGDDVTCLQNYLKGTGHFTYSGGATGFFGGVTKSAVAAWQSANGVSPAVGYFGPLSQAKYSSMVVVVPVVPGVTPGVVSLGSGLTVSAGMQPSEALAPNSAARIPFTKVVLSASADGDVWVKSLTVERQGVGVDAALSEVVLLDEDGIQVGLGKTLNSNHQVMLNEWFLVKAGTSRTMWLGASRPASDSTSVAGQIIRLALVGVDAGSALVHGSLPIVGNGMTMNASLTLGSVTVQTGSFKTVATTTEDIGKTAFKFTSVRVTAGSQEKVRITSIRWNQVGSAGVGDVANVKTVFDGTEYDAVASTDGKYYTSKFGSGMVLDKGMSAEIYIKGDIMGGANRTVKFDLYRTTDLAVSGETYGYGITPPTSGTGFTSTNPWYFASQVTVGKGSLNVENATTIQAQNIAVNLSNQVLGGFSVEVRGEPVSVAKMIFDIATTSTG